MSEQKYNLNYSDIRWNGYEWEIYMGYPLGHVSLNAELNRLASKDDTCRICESEQRALCADCMKQHKDEVEKLRSALSGRVRFMENERLTKELSEVKAELDAAYTVANNAIYFADGSDYLTALYQVCATIKPGIEDEEIGKGFIDKQHDASL